MRCERVTDPNVILSVLGIPEIAEAIADDTRNIDNWHPDPEREIFLGCWGDELVAIQRFHWVNGVTLQAHTHVVPEYRKEYAHEAAKAGFRWVLDNTECLKVIAFIPKVFHNVFAFAKSMGFAEEGQSRASYLKDGTLYDQWLVGISREGMKAHV